MEAFFVVLLAVLMLGVGFGALLVVRRLNVVARGNGEAS
jgi:F0F1-type ATP synthase assembly protein I